MANYRIVHQPTQVPVPGCKVIEEIFGRVNTGTEAFSLAHMVAPPGWIEPPQTPDFGEATVMVRGKLRILIDGEPVVLEAGQSLWVEAGTTVHYGNPFEEEAEYYALCLPAFAPELAHRQDEGEGA
jgi:quercetin dioxygenase-like cupin family protein